MSSFWARLTGKELQIVEQLEKKFDSLRKSSNSEFLALVGMKGKAKGMDIINTISDDCAFDKNQLKRLYAKLSEVYFRIANIDVLPDKKEEMDFIEIQYANSLRFFIIPIPQNELFAVVSLTENLSKLLNGVQKLIPKINELKSSA